VLTRDLPVRSVGAPADQCSRSAGSPATAQRCCSAVIYIQGIRRKTLRRELKRGKLSQRETKKQASPMVTRSSSRATKMSLMFNAATKRCRIS